MGLDWCIEKHPEGTHPVEVLGGRKLDRNDPESVKAFLELVAMSWFDSANAQDKPDIESLIHQHEGEWLANTIEHNPSTCYGMFASAWDFRGKLIGLVQGLDQATYNKAYQCMNPSKMRDYADELEGYIDDDLVSSDDANTLKQAIEWLRFWSAKGFSMHAWY